MPEEKLYYIYIIASKSRAIYVGMTAFLLALGEPRLRARDHLADGEGKDSFRTDATGSPRDFLAQAMADRDIRGRSATSTSNTTWMSSRSALTGADPKVGASCFSALPNKLWLSIL